MLLSRLDAFATMREVHNLVIMLDVAAGAPLDAAERQTLAQLTDALTPEDGWTVESLETFERSGTSQRTRQFLRSLKHHFGDRR